MVMKTQTGQSTRAHKLPGIICEGHYFTVPLDYGRAAADEILVYARELVSPQNVGKEELPWLLFLQGGPGFPSPRPESTTGWIKRALTDFRVLLLDQRGTGLSSPVTHQTLASIGDAKSQAAYLKHFRADNIVRDCEFIRKTLSHGAPWTVLGQSYGGFCIGTYLSIAQEGLNGAIIAGGLPPLVSSPNEVYRATYRRVIEKNKLFYERYPEDVDVVWKIIDHLSSEQVSLPTGEILSPRRFLQLGFDFGFGLAGQSLNTIHYLLEEPFVPNISKSELSYLFLHELENKTAFFNTNPLFSLLHEPLYCQKQASNWSADRILKEFPEFDLGNKAAYFSGEMIYSWMFDEYECLKPLKNVACLLAEYSDWPELYDPGALRRNTVPCVACVYYDDMYVDRKLSEETASNISGIKLWITNEYEHDALRQEGEAVLDRLLAMLRGEK